jgi:hypothetical protein
MIVLQDGTSTLNGGTVFVPTRDDPIHVAGGIDSTRFMGASGTFDNEVETFNVSGTTITEAGNNIAMPNTPTNALPSYLGGSKWIVAGLKSSQTEAFAFSAAVDALSYRHSSAGIPGSII